MARDLRSNGPMASSLLKNSASSLSPERLVGLAPAAAAVGRVAVVVGHFGTKASGEKNAQKEDKKELSFLFLLLLEMNSLQLSDSLFFSSPHPSLSLAESLLLHL